MKRIAITALISLVVALAVVAFAVTRPVRPDVAIQQGSLVLQASEPIAKTDHLTSADLQRAVLDRLPASRRVDYEDALDILAITYDNSVKTQFFITYHYSTYGDSISKLFFDANVHNHVVKGSLDAAISEVLAKHNARIRPAEPQR